MTRIRDADARPGPAAPPSQHGTSSTGCGVRRAAGAGACAANPSHISETRGEDGDEKQASAWVAPKSNPGHPELARQMHHTARRQGVLEI